MPRKQKDFKTTVGQLARDPRVQRAVMTAIPILLALMKSRKDRKKKK